MTSIWQTAGVTALGVAALAMVAVTLAMARRSRSAWEALSRRVDEVSLRLRAVETSNRASHSGGPDSLLSGSRSDKRPGTAVAGGSAGASPGLLRLRRPDSGLSGPPGIDTDRRLRVDLTVGSAVSGPILISVPSLAAVGSDAVAHEAALAFARRFGPVWDLADAGRTPAAIAEATGHPVGQVELILALRRQATAPAEAVGRG